MKKAIFLAIVSSVVATAANAHLPPPPPSSPIGSAKMEVKLVLKEKNERRYFSEVASCLATGDIDLSKGDFDSTPTYGNGLGGCTLNYKGETLKVFIGGALLKGMYDSSEGTANVFIQVTSPKEVAENPMNAPSPLAVAEGKTIVRGDQIRTVILEARPTSRFIVSKNGDNVMIEAVAKITEIKTK